MPARWFALTLFFASGLAGCEQASAPEEGVPKLLTVAESGGIPALDALLADAATPDVRDACRWTPLMRAAATGNGI